MCFYLFSEGMKWKTINFYSKWFWLEMPVLVWSMNSPNFNSLYLNEFNILFVGKTCLVRRFTQGLFPPGQGATIGVDFMIKTVVVDNEKIKVSALWILKYSDRLMHRPLITVANMGHRWSREISIHHSKLLSFSARPHSSLRHKLPANVWLFAGLVAWNSRIRQFQSIEDFSRYVNTLQYSLPSNTFINSELIW